MRKMHVTRLVQITLVLIGVLMIVQPVLCADVSKQVGIILQNSEGMIVGDKLMLIDKTGKQTVAPDATYKIQDGTKITVKKGKIVDLPAVKSKVKGSKVGIIGQE